MKEQVTDILVILQDMMQDMQLMRETINQQYADILKLNRNIDALNCLIRKKDAKNKELRERLSKYENPGKDSCNSSTPPGKEGMRDEVVRRTKSPRKPSGRKAGGQQGHEGHKLTLSDTPDVIVDDAPNYCTNCGGRVRTAPRRRANEVVYDASVKSLVVYLNTVQFLPFGRIASFLREILGLTPSESSLVKWVMEAKRKA